MFKNILNKISYYSNKYPLICMSVVLSCILGFMFRELFSPSLVLFSNDGPYGTMQSDWLRIPIKEGPGSAVWVNLNWLGQNGGEIPITFSYIIMWLSSNPVLVLSLLFLSFSIFIYTRGLKIDKNKKTK